jgi:hypothetical protein
MTSAPNTPVKQLLMYCWQADDEGSAFMQVGGNLSVEIPNTTTAQQRIDMNGRHAIIIFDDGKIPRIGNWMPVFAPSNYRQKSDILRLDDHKAAYRNGICLALLGAVFFWSTTAIWYFWPSIMAWIGS